MCLDMLWLFAFSLIVLKVWVVSIANYKMNRDYIGIIISVVLSVMLIISAVILLFIHFSGNCMPWNIVD